MCIMKSEILITFMLHIHTYIVGTDRHMHVGHVRYVNNVASTPGDFSCESPSTLKSSLMIYSSFCMKIYLYTFLVSLCVASVSIMHCQTFPCRKSLKMSPSKRYIKKTEIVLQRGRLGTLQLSTDTSKKLACMGITRLLNSL